MSSNPTTTRKTPSRRPAALLQTTLLGLLALATCPLYAHHGRDFLLADSANLPHTGDLYVIAQQSYIDAGDDYEIEVEPAVFFGLTQRISLELHSHVAQENGEDWTYESTAPALHLRLNPLDSSWAFGASFEYELSNVDELADVAEGRLILSRDARKDKCAFNVIAEREQESGADLEWSYAAAYRRLVNLSLALGVELRGDVEHPGDGEALLGIYVDRGRWWTLNMGIGTGYGDQELDLTARTSLVIRVGG